jgi:membrane protease YdiL (CAAX protease family)
MDDRVAGWVLALAISTMLVVLSERDRRRYALGAIALLLLFVVTLAVASWMLAPAGRPWAPAIAAAAVWLAVQPLLGLGRMSRKEIGLVPPRPGSVHPAIVVTMIALIANAAIIAARNPAPVTLSLALMIAVIVAAIVEELAIRGVILALADRASPPRWTLWGARLGLGGVIVTAAFIVLHGLRPGMLLGVVPAAMLYLWLRARTGSLLPPIVAHILWNLSVVLLHR